ncbi:MAG: ABC transporter permease [Planctomycetia bacterium]|nr:ABC transporter permease [Planctomycetia bacterium]
MKPSRFPFIMTILILIFFYAPLLMMVVHSLQVKVPGSGEVIWSTERYAHLFKNPRVLEVTINTIIIGVSTAIISTILGTLAALAVFKYKSKLQTFHRGLLYAPLILPEVLVGISLLLCFSAANIPLGMCTIIAAHTSFCTSYVAVIVMASLEDYDFTLLEASRDLGATSWQTTWQIILPLLWPAIIAGALLAFTLSLDDFIVTFFVSGIDCMTLPVYIYNLFKRRGVDAVYALSSVLLAATFLLVTVAALCAGRNITKTES